MPSDVEQVFYTDETHLLRDFPVSLIFGILLPSQTGFSLEYYLTPLDCLKNAE